MTSPLFGFSISPGDPTPTALEAADAEAMGYDRIGVWDSPALFREPWVVLPNQPPTSASITPEFASQYRGEVERVPRAYLRRRRRCDRTVDLPCPARSSCGVATQHTA